MPLSTKGSALKTSNPKRKYMCEGGPYDGHEIYLSIDRPTTAEFSLRGFKGRYAPKREELANGGRIDSLITVEWISS